MPLGSERKPRRSVFDRDPEDTNRDRATRHETRMAEVLRARLTPNSGALPMPSQKGDLQGEDMLWQAKLTEGQRIVISAEVVDEVCRQAAAVGKEPGIIVTVEGMPDPLPKDWILIPASLVGIR